MTLEDARIVVVSRMPLVTMYKLRPRPDPDHFESWSHATDLKLNIACFWLAVVTVQRHLPVPLYLPFSHYVMIGWVEAKGVTFVPYKGAYPILL